MKLFILAALVLSTISSALWAGEVEEKCNLHFRFGRYLEHQGYPYFDEKMREESLAVRNAMIKKLQKLNYKVLSDTSAYIPGHYYFKGHYSARGGQNTVSYNLQKAISETNKVLVDKAEKVRGGSFTFMAKLGGSEKAKRLMFHFPKCGE